MTELRYFIKTGILNILLFISGCTVKEHVAKSDEIQPLETSYDYLWVIKPTVNIRSNSSVNSPQVGTLNDGDSVIVILNKEGWYQIRTILNQNGWIRSDLLGPQSLSIYPKAAEFADSIKTTENVDLFFDKRLHHRRIYLTFPPALYVSRDSIIATSKRISTAYQTEVFSGTISVIILNAGGEEIYYSFDQNGLVNSDVLLPVVPFGKIIDAQLGPRKADLTYIVEENIPENTYIESARDMVDMYPISYREIILKFLDKNKNCRFWYKEDDSGEIFEFNSCQ